MPREGARVLFKNGTHILPLFISVDNAKSANITVIDTYSVMASVHISIGEIAVGDLVTLRDCTVGMIHGCYNVTRRQTSNFSYSLILNVTHLATQEDFKVQFSKCRILLNRQLYVDKGNVSTPGLVSNCSGINTCGVITFMSILVLERLSITHGRAFGGAARFGLPIQSSMSSAEILSSTGFRVSNMIYAYISTTMRIPAGTHVKVSNCGQYESVVVKANLVQQQHILSVLLGDPMMNKDKTKMEVCIYDCQDELLHGVYDIISYSSPVNISVRFTLNIDEVNYHGCRIRGYGTQENFSANGILVVHSVLQDHIAFYNGLGNKHTICNTGRALPIRFGKARFHQCFANKGKEVTLALKNSVRSVVDIVENVYLFYRNKSLIVHLKKDSSAVRSGNSISIEGNSFDMVNEIYIVERRLSSTSFVARLPTLYISAGVVGTKNMTKIILGGKGLPVQVDDILKLIHPKLNAENEQLKVLEVISNWVFYIESCTYCKRNFTGGSVQIVSLKKYKINEDLSIEGVSNGGRMYSNEQYFGIRSILFEVDTQRSN